MAHDGKTLNIKQINSTRLVLTGKNNFIGLDWQKSVRIG